MSSAPLLVTASLGNVGTAVMQRLATAGVGVRAADIDPAIVATRHPDAEAARLDFRDPSSWTAFEGVHTMFLVRPPALGNVRRDMLPALRAARDAGVGHVVLLSLQGAEHNPVVPHAKLESWLRSSGLSWTFVRPSFFMENMSTTHASDIRDRDCLMVPAGSGTTSFVAVDDVADVITAALLDPPGHRNRAWTPTGPAALTYTRVCAILSDVLERPITYGRPGVARYLRHATHELGMPMGMAVVTVAIYSAARFGMAAGLSHDVRTVTGHPPTDFAEWAMTHREAWDV